MQGEWLRAVLPKDRSNSMICCGCCQTTNRAATPTTKSFCFDLDGNRAKPLLVKMIER